MQLTEKHIEDLMLFTKKHYVPYYDLQMELVDHLANDIEELINANPRLSYEEAKRIAFKKFGVFGFQETIEAKRKALNKRYFKLFLSTFLNYFTIPKIIVSVSFFVLFYFTLHTFSTYLKVIFYLANAGIIFYGLYHSTVYHYKLKRKNKETGKKWLFETMTDILFAIIMSCNLIIQLTQLFFIKQLNASFHSSKSLFIFSLFTTTLFLVIHIASVILPKKISLIMQKEYPNYKPV